MSKYNSVEILDRSRGQWSSILSDLTGVSQEYLRNRNGPCPVCGGKDRFRFDNKNGDGTWFCNQGDSCHHSAKNAGNGIGLLMDLEHCSFGEALELLANYHGIRPYIKTISPNKSLNKEPMEYEWDNYRVASSGKFIRIMPILVERWFDQYYIVRSEWVDAKTNEKKKASYQVYYDQLTRALTIISLKEKKPLLGVLDLDPCKACLIVEGEKCYRVAKSAFGHKYNVLTWVGGAKQIQKSDFDTLENLDVIIWPDADIEGVVAAEKLNVIGENIFNSLKFLLPPENVKKGWDIADSIDEEWSLKSIEDLIETSSSSIMELKERFDFTGDKKPYIPLGISGKNIFFVTRKNKQLHKWKASEVSSKTLPLIAPYEYWINLFPKRSDNEKLPTPDFTKAGSSLIEACVDKGFFDESKIRGCGSWSEEDKNIFNTGKQLLVDGEPKSFFENDLENFYEAAKPLDIILRNPLTDKEGAFLVELLEKFSFPSKDSAKLIAGWIYSAIISGCLSWRTHIWITGPAGSGKSTLFDRILTPLLNKKVALKIMGGATEAGIRAFIKKNNMSVLYDESEPEGKPGKARNEGILFLCRVSSSDDGGKILKGSPHQEVIEFILNSQFCFSSTMVNLESAPDKERFVIIPLTLEDQCKESFESLEASLPQIGTDFADRLITRSVNNVATTKANIKAFSKVIAERLGSKRLADNFSVLLAGWQGLMHDQILSEEQIQQIVDDFKFENFLQDTKNYQERDVLAEIMQSELRIDLTNQTKVHSIGYWVEEIICSRNSELSDEDQVIAGKKLRSIGIKVCPMDEYILVAYNSKFISKALKQTRYIADYHTLLSRIPGAERVKSQRFGPGIGSRGVDNAIKIKLDILFGENWEEKSRIW